MVKGYQDAKGAPLPNAHLMGLFQRLCKLLYFRIKPVFVFDGGFPDLKRETIVSANFANFGAFKIFELCKVCVNFSGQTSRPQS